MEKDNEIRASIAFSYFDNENRHVGLDLTLENDSIDELVWSFKRFLFAVGYLKETIDDHCQCEYG